VSQCTNCVVRVANKTGQAVNNVVAYAFRWVYSAAQLVSPPVISGQPQSQRVIEGGSASFDVAADGSNPLSFQWRLNSVPMAGQTNATLVLGAVHPADAGAYDVTVSNLAGDTVSAAASLVVSTRPTLGSLMILTNRSSQFTLT